MATRISRVELAKRVASDIPEGAYVNLGIGAPIPRFTYAPSGMSDATRFASSTRLIRVAIRPRLPCW